MTTVLVIVDTTELKRDRFLGTNDFRLLLRAAERGDLRVGVTEVTFREAVNHVREHAAKTLATLETAMRSLRNLREAIPGLVTDLTPEGIAEHYTQFFRGELERHHVEIFPTPPIPHDKVVQRALDRRKPFDKEGHKGYRDALIWETIREQADATSEPITFITNSGSLGRVFDG